MTVRRLSFSAVQRGKTVCEYAVPPQQGGSLGKDAVSSLSGTRPIQSLFLSKERTQPSC